MAANKNKKNLMLLGILSVLVLVLLIVKSSEKKNISGTFSLIKMDETKTDKIEIVRNAKDTLAISKLEGGWKFSKPIVYDIDEKKLENLLRFLQNVEVNKKVYSESKKSQHKHKVDSTGILLRLFSRDKIQDEFYVGNRTPVGNNTFVRKVNSDKIYENLSSDNNNQNIVDAKFETWRKKEILKIEKDILKSFDFEFEDYSYKAELIDTLWNFYAENQVKNIPDNTITKMISKITSINANNFIDTNLTDFDFRDCDYRLKITTNDFEEYSILGIIQDDDNKAHNGKLILKLVGNDKTLFVQSKTYFTNFEKKLVDFENDK